MTDFTARLRIDLELAAQTLRRYEALHRAKGTPESTEKAEANAALAQRFEETLEDPMPRYDHNWLTGEPAAHQAEIDAWWARRQQTLDWSDAPLPPPSQPDRAMIMPRPTWYPADAVGRMLDDLARHAKAFGLEVGTDAVTGSMCLRRIDGAPAGAHADPARDTLQLWIAAKCAHPSADHGDNVAFYRALEHFQHAVAHAESAAIASRDERIAELSRLLSNERAYATELKLSLTERGERIAAMHEELAGMEADLREERDRIASMRVEWGAEVATLQAEGAKSERRAIEFGDALHRHILAMRAAFVAWHRAGANEGMAWVINTLAGPGHLPSEADIALGAQALFDKEVADHEAFRAAHPGPGPATSKPSEASHG